MIVVDLPRSSTRVATGATKATTVAMPPVPDGVETITVGLDSVALPDFGATVVCETSGATVLVVLDRTTVVVGDNIVVVVVVVEVVVVVVAAAAVNELLDCE